MGILKRETPWQREYRAVWKQEEKFLEQYGQRSAASALDQKLDEKIPPALRETLHQAFVKAFRVVFEKGDGPIQKMVHTDKRQQAYMIRRYQLDRGENQKTLRAFHKSASASGRGSVLCSGAAGMCMGLLGVALPDIPLFTGILLKCVYETADNYGFAVETAEEKLLALRVIEAALSDGSDLRERSRRLDQYFQNGCWPDEAVLDEQIQATARQLSEAMLYGKFLQNIPVVGIAGGMQDSVYLHRVQRYAAIKYRKRFLLERRR